INLVADGDMEDAGVTSWTILNPSTFSTTAKDTTGVFADTQSLKYVVSSPTGSYSGYYQQIPVSQNTTYHFEGWVKTSNIYYGPTIRIDEGALSYPSDPTNRITFNWQNQLTAANAWTKVTGDFKTSSGVSVVTLFLVRAHTTGTETTYFDNITLTPNSVDNGGMEGTLTSEAPSGWVEAWNAGTGSAETSAQHSGSQAYKYTHDGTTSSGGIRMSSAMAIDDNSWYLVSFWGKADSGFSLTGSLNGGEGGGLSATLTTSWLKFSYVKKGSDFNGTVGYADKLAFYTGSASKVFYIDDVSVTPLSNVATSFKAWTPVTDTGSNAELVPTGHFDSNITGWSTLATTGYSYETFEWSNGKLHAVNDLVTNTPYFGYANSPVFSVTAGKQYLVEFDLVNNAGTLPQFTIASSDQGGGITSESYVPSTVGHNRKVFNGITSSGSGRFFFNNYNNVADYTLDNVTVKEIANPLSIHGSSTGVASTTGVRGNAYTFDGSTGFLRQKMYDTNVGTLSYQGDDTTTAEFRDTSQNFDDWDVASGNATYLLKITNSDATQSWGFMGTNNNSGQDIDIYTSIDRGTRGWSSESGGTLPVTTAKTPVAYEVYKVDHDIVGDTTLMFWFKTSATNADNRIIDKYATGNGYYMKTIASGILYAATLGTGSATSTSTTAVNDGVWHYITWVIDAGANQYLYIDGILEDTDAITLTSTAAPYPLYLMANDGTAGFVAGSLDSYAHVKAALTAAQIKELYNASSEKYTLVSNNESANGIKESAATIDANYHNFEISQNGTAASLSVDGATPVTTAVNLANEDSYVRLQNSDSTNTASVDWVYVRKYAATAPVATPATEEVGPGPVGYWKFDDPTSTPSGGTSGQAAMDSSGQGNNGVLGSTINADSADPTWQSEDMCVSGKCLKFDGSSAGVTATVTQARTSVLSVGLWIKPVTLTSRQDFISSGDAGTYPTNNWIFSIKGNSSNNASLSVFGSTTELNTGANVLSANKWQYVVFVSDGTNVSIYIDGKLVISNVLAINNSNSTGEYIGRSSAIYFQGTIDEVKIYPYARSAAQIKADYNAKGSSSTKGTSVALGTNVKSNDAFSNGLVGYWKMDETSGNIIDASGNNNSGTITGTTVIAGKYGNTRNFSSTSDIAAITSIAIPGSWSISSWFKYPFPSASCNTLTRGVNYDHQVIIQCGGTLLGTYDNHSLGWVSSGFNTNTLSNGWHHLTAVGDGGVTKFYIDGSYVGTSNYQSNSEISYIGNYQGGNQQFGSIDETRIYNRALSPKEVRDLYNWATGAGGVLEDG
ncbi:hypothetical protein COY32_03175, partial [candidate division WWE3 bacterium CG_4_10_14_0_2_um_filter_41_14]